MDSDIFLQSPRKPLFAGTFCSDPVGIQTQDLQNRNLCTKIRQIPSIYTVFIVLTLTD